jgi:hypothetical protein
MVVVGTVVAAGAAAATAAVIGVPVWVLRPALLSAARSPRRTITAGTPTAMVMAMAIPTDPAVRGAGFGTVTLGFGPASSIAPSVSDHIYGVPQRSAVDFNLLNFPAA